MKEYKKGERGRIPNRIKKSVEEDIKNMVFIWLGTILLMTVTSVI